MNTMTNMDERRKKTKKKEIELCHFISNEILDHLDRNMYEKKVHFHNQLIDEENPYLDKQLDVDVLKI